MKENGFKIWRRQLSNSGCLLLGDAIVLLVALWVGNVILYLSFQIPVSIKYSLMLIPVWCGGAGLVGLVPGWGLGAVEELRRTQLLLLTVFALATMAYFFSREIVLPSRIVYMVSYIFGALFIPVGRAVTRRFLIKLRLWGCPAVIYGDAEEVPRIVSAFTGVSEIGYMPVGIFSGEFAVGEEVQGIKVLGGIEDTTANAPVAIVSLTHFPEKRLTPFLDNTLAGYRKVILLPNIHEDAFSWIIPRNFGGLIGLEVTRNLMRPLAGKIKTWVEFLIVLATLPFWLPLLLLFSLLIFTIDKHNPFYVQTRYGRLGKPFKTIKFRTMPLDADEILKKTLAADPELNAEWESNYKLENDPRVTPLGRQLRRYSLDELPQLINVLMGQMSLVGPRPLPDYHQKSLSGDVKTPRNQVKPGMTGLWQVSGRSSLCLTDMEKWDTYYVRNWSVWLDLIILGRTIHSVLSSRGAF